MNTIPAYKNSPSSNKPVKKMNSDSSIKIANKHITSINTPIVAK